MFQLQEIKSSQIITKSQLPKVDYVINPYVGCPHRCIYCYAEFMKRFTNHTQDWGTFLDIKTGFKPISKSIIKDKKILISSVTDAYNPYEYKYQVTRHIIKDLIDSQAHIDILTKSHLVIRDIDLLKQCPNLRVGISMNSTDESFRKLTEPGASSIDKRIHTLKTLKAAGIQTYLFVSPIFPHITSIPKLLQITQGLVDTYYFENLNLRASYKPRVLNLIKDYFPNHYPTYETIYLKHQYDYWEAMKLDIVRLCEKRKVQYELIFHYGKVGN